MVYQYETNSPKLSRGYAEPENKYNDTVGYQPASTGFADSLESQYYFDRPASSKDRANAAQNSYAEQPTYNRPTQQEYRDNAYDNGYAPKASAKPQLKDPSFRERYLDTVEEERAQDLSARYKGVGENAPNYAKEQMVYTTDDTAPSATTMQYYTGESANPFEDYRQKGEAVDKKYTINTRGKVLIAVYALVVATIFALIILNTRLLKNMNATSVAKQQEIVRLSEQIEDLHSELDYVSSDAVIEEKAAEKGMVKG